MKRVATRAALIGAATVLFAAAIAGPVVARSGHNSTSVHLFSDGSVVSGASSSLVRNGAGARFGVSTSGLEPGHAVTVWWVIFNEPENCLHGHDGVACGAGDLPPFGGDDSAVTSVLYAAGNVTGGSGRVTLSGHLSVGDTDGALWGPGLIDPWGAEIHLVVRDHGEKAPGQTDDAIHDFGTCTPECTAVQFAIHTP